MANTTITPLMGLIVPSPTVDPGPDWANNLNASLNILDGHNHSPGSGTQITPAGINISTDLPFNSNNATGLRSVRFNTQSGPLSNPSDVGCLYENGVDLWYNDGAGNQIPITALGSVTGAAGTITGLPSGTAGAAYAGGTFTFTSATNTPANMAFGPFALGTNTASSKTITFQPNGSQAADYTLTYPAAAPTAGQSLISDGSGNFTWTTNSRGQTPLGAIVATFPDLTGAYTTGATTIADAAGWVLCNGQTISDATSPMNGDVIPNVNNSVFIQGSTTSNTSGGAASVTLSANNLAAHNHAVTYSSGSSVAGQGHTHIFPHDHQSLYVSNSAGWFAANSSSAYTATWTTTSGYLFGVAESLSSASFGSFPCQTGAPATGSLYTSGALNPPNGTAVTNPLTGTESTTTTLGTSNQSTTNSAFSIIPTYISAVYLMRVR